MNIIPPTTTVCFLLTVQHSLHTTQRLHKMYSTGLHTLYNYTAATSFFYITLTFFPSLYCTHFLVISIPHSLSSHLYTPRHSLYSHLYTTLTFLSSPFFVYCSNFWNNVSYCDAQSCPKALPNNNNYSEVPPLSAATTQHTITTTVCFYPSSIRATVCFLLASLKHVHDQMHFLAWVSYI